MIANRGACWQKCAPGLWKRTEADSHLDQDDDVATDQAMIRRVESVMGRVELEVTWTLY